MAAKKNNYINEDLDWLEQRAANIKKNIDDNPYDKIDDRIVPLQGARGITETVVQTREAIQKAQREAMKDYALLIEVIDKLRQQEEAKVQARGNAELSPQAEEWLSKRI